MAAEEETAGGVDEATKQEEETGEDMLTKIFHNYESDVKVNAVAAKNFPLSLSTALGFVHSTVWACGTDDAILPSCLPLPSHLTLAPSRRLGLRRGKCSASTLARHWLRRASICPMSK